MIYITEIKSFKCPGETSLRIDFEYNADIISILKQSDGAIWHKTQKFWEAPANQLAFLIDNLTYLDSISFSCFEDEAKNNYNLTLNYKTKPFDYQLEGIKWMLNNPNGLLQDPPGLGKTLQVIYLAEELKAQENYEHCLILCGINSLKNNWKKEILKHSNESCVIIGEKINSKGKVSYTSIKDRAEQLYNKIDEYFIILNVESLRDNLIIDAIRDSHNKFDLICFDEVHRAKSPTSQQGKNLLKLSKVGKRHIGMTGTLLLNSPLDAFVPLKFIGKENSTWTNFKNYYCVYEQKFGHNQIVAYKNINVLKEEIDSCSLRRDKSILNLPPKTIIPEFIDMDSTQQKFYEDMMNGIVDDIDKVKINTTNLLGMITRLRQATSAPSVLSSSEIIPTKIERAIDLIEEIISGGEKVVVFSYFKEPLYILQDKLKQYKPLIGTGDLDDKQVSDNIDKFQNDPEYKVFLGTVQKVGTGQTLTAATYMIHLDTSWTWADFDQACDRIWRIGSERPVIIYNLICNGTIDERVWNLLNRKKNISDYMIDGKVNDLEELKELLGI